MIYLLFYPALTGSKTPPQCLRKSRSVGGRSTARKSPIGSTNNQWGMRKTPLIEVSLYLSWIGKLLIVDNVLFTAKILPRMSVMPKLVRRAVCIVKYFSALSFEANK